MTADQLDLLGPIFADVGREAVRLTGGDPDGIFLYVEAGNNWVGTSLFKDEGASLRYIDLGEQMTLEDLLIEAWKQEPAEKRWTSMQYTIDHGKFAAEFGFDDLEDAEEHTGDRRARVLQARYGDKSVIYPPPSPDAWTLKPPA